MNQHIIKQIVEEIFDKAKKSCSSHAPNALSKHIADESDYEFNYRTAERAYKRYIDNNTEIGAPIPETINSFCKYLDYDDYKDYVKKKIKDKVENEELEVEENTTINNNLRTDVFNTNEDVEQIGDERENISINRKRVYTIVFILLAISVLFLYNNLNKPNKKRAKESLIQCMVWAINHYEKADCNIQLHPEYGTKVEPYDASRSKMEKIKVNAATKFFSEETGRPLIWYYKTKEGTIEYFTSPGLHPVNNETLKKITKGMIQKYVPIHNTQPDSFISTDKINSTKADIAILVLNGNDFDNQLTSALKTKYLSKNSSIIRLKDTAIYDETFISNFNPNAKLFLDSKLIKVDTLILGIAKYEFSNNLDLENTITCSSHIEFSILYKKNNLWEEETSKNLNRIGIGYSRIEAKINSLNKINYE